ncbi:MAG: glycosyltransferase [Allorhizobium sp.]
MANRAASRGTTIEQELLASGTVREDAYYGALARLAGLPFIDSIPEGSVLDGPGLDSQLKAPRCLRLTDPVRPPLTLIAPEATRIQRLQESLKRHPSLRQSLAIAPASLIREAAWKAGAERRVKEAVNTLFDDRPSLSARTVMTARQGFWTGALASGALVFLIIAPGLAATAFHLLLSMLYFAAFCLRLGVLGHSRRQPPPCRSIVTATAALDDGALPVYTVMVALYREAEIAAQLIASIERLDWPRSRLDVKLVCEADDAATLAAIRGLAPPSHFEIVEVPPMAPRTKPKALSYALAGVRGDYLAVYDAEDRPHPGQLKEAYHSFQALPDEIACLQAPLVIANMRQSWTSALFALEYAALFRRMLPIIARYRMPLPLGGTSNHFRTAPLISVGGWDPFNVTEDADLGMRLYRFGYRSATIRRQTLEDAPTSQAIWLGQRTRWYKGWLQTWLVLMRAPAVTIKEMGPAAFLTFQLMIGGMLISALGHPLIFAFIVATGITMLTETATSVGALHRFLFVIDAINILGSYLAFLALGLTAMTGHERGLLGYRWLRIPAYWMMTSLAAWKAVIELRSRPFFWNKTQHRPHTATAPAKGADPAPEEPVPSPGPGHGPPK